MALARHVRVEADGRLAHAIDQDHLALVGAARAVVQVLRVLRVAVERLEAVQLLQLLHQRLLDLVLGDEVRHRAARERVGRFGSGSGREGIPDLQLGEMSEVVDVARHQGQPMHQGRRCDDRVRQSHAALLA